jgi:glycosyltransferase involved in cell wall biosynthesis
MPAAALYRRVLTGLLTPAAISGIVSAASKPRTSPCDREALAGRPAALNSTIGRPGALAALTGGGIVSERPLRFAMVTTFYPPYHFGGDAVGIQRLSRALVRRGHHVTIIHNADAWKILNRGGEPPAASEPAGLVVETIRTRTPLLACLITHQTGRPGLYRRRVRRLLESGRFDVINFHNVSLAFGPGVLSYGSAAKLYMAHEHWLVCPSHVLWRHNRELCTGRQCLRCVLAFRRPPQLWRSSGLLERELRHVDTIIAVSHHSALKHREFGLPRAMRVLPYFQSDPDGAGMTVPRTRTPRIHDRPFFLFVGRLEVIKGLQDVIPLFREYEAADLLIAGDGEHGAVLRDLARGCPRVKFLGRVAVEDLSTYYREAIALIAPSICYETFGIVLIEAFRQRTPVIARRLGPFPEIVETAGGGLLFSTTEELMAAMKTLQNDTAARTRMAAAAYEAYIEHWSESAVVPRYLDIAREAIERRDARQCER